MAKWYYHLTGLSDGEEVVFRNQSYGNNSYFETDSACDMVEFINKVTELTGQSFMEEQEGKGNELAQEAKLNSCPFNLIIKNDPPETFTGDSLPDGDIDTAEEDPGSLGKDIQPSQNTLGNADTDSSRPEDPNAPPPQEPPPGEPEIRSADKSSNIVNGGEPVDLFSGEFFIEHTDFELPSIGFPFIFIRTYKSGKTFFGPWGYNWDHNYNIYIRELKDGSLAVNTGKLREHIYKDSGDSINFVAPRGVYAIARKQNAFSGTAYEITHKGGMKWYFEIPSGWSHPQNRIPLIKIEDTNGNNQQLIYDNRNLLSTVIDTAGRKIGFINGNCALLEALQPEFLQETGKPPVEIKYMHANNIEQLSAVISFPTPDFPEGLMTCYEYDEEQPLAIQRNNITRIIDAKGQTVVENFYGTDTTEDSFNRVVRQYFMGGEYLFHYSSLRYIPPDDAHINDAYLQTEFYEPGRPLKLFTFNFRGNLLDERFRLSADGTYHIRANSYRYNANGEIIEKYHANGMAEFYTFDELNPDIFRQGNLLNIRLKSQPNRLSSRDILKFTYEPLYQKIKTIVDEAGKSVQFLYDHDLDPLKKTGNLVQIKYPDVTSAGGNVQSNCKVNLIYDNKGQLIREESAEGRIKKFEYILSGNGAGLVKQIIFEDADGQLVQSFEYDAMGNVLKTKDNAGNETGIKTNLLGQTYEIVLPPVIGQQAFFRIEYNADGNISREYIPKGSYNDHIISGEWIIHEYHYNVASWLVKEVKNSNTAFPQVTTYERDFHGNIIRKMNPLGQEDKFTYDDRNLLLKHIAYSNSEKPLITRYSHDRMGRHIKTVFPNSNEIRFDYSDPFSRLKSKTDHLGVKTINEYDVRDELKKITVQDKTDSVLQVISSKFDEKGRLIQSSLNNLVSRYIYDKDDLVMKVINNTGGEFNNTYDGLGRLIEQVDPAGNVVRQKYDVAGNIDAAGKIFISGQTGNTFNLKSKITFDSRNRPVKFTDTFGNEVHQVYDDRNLVTEITDAFGNKSMIDYDVNGFPVKSSLVVNGSETLIAEWKRDLMGRIIRFKDAAGNQTTYEYDELNNLIRTVYPDGSSDTKDYDEHNYLKKEIDPNGSVINFGYNNLKQLTEMSFQPAAGIHGSQPVEFGYDSFGRRTYMKKGSVIVERKYDFMNRIIEEKQGGRVVLKKYEDALAQMTLVYPDTREDIYQADKSGRLGSIILNKKGSSDLPAGSIQEGTELVKYIYDGLFLKSMKLADGTTTDYIYDQEGKLTGYEIKNAANALIDKEQYVYDRNKRKCLLVRKPLPGVNRYMRYDELGRLKEAGIPAGNIQIPGNFINQAATENFLNGIDLSNPAGKESYLLSLNDRRNSWVVNGIQFTTGYNAMHQITQLQEGAGNPGHYSYDNNGNRIEDKDFHYEFDVFDKLVKVRRKSDGSVILEYIYDAEGRIVEKTEGSVHTQYILDGLRNIEERKGTEIRQNTSGRGIDEILIVSENGNDNFCHYNDQSSLQLLTDGSGAVLHRYDYSSFGDPAVYNSMNQVLDQASLLREPFFCGRPYHKKLKLYEFRQRAYDPKTGSFLQRDPLGYTDSANAYLYCRHDPHNRTDVTGTVSDSWTPAYSQHKPLSDDERENLGKLIGDTSFGIWNAFSAGSPQEIYNQTNLGTWEGLGESAFIGIKSFSNLASLGFQNSIYGSITETKEAMFDWHFETFEETAGIPAEIGYGLLASLIGTPAGMVNNVLDWLPVDEICVLLNSE
jgi:RHS repeat-associated protein